MHHKRSTNTTRILAVADTHGHPTLLQALVDAFDERYGTDWVLVTLGDYTDNGPDIPGLLDLLVALRRQRPDRFVPILGNHDLACLRTLGWPDSQPDELWYQRWSATYWGWYGPGGGTPAAYGARSASELAARMPVLHQAFLRALPWYYDDGQHLFVHAGMEAGPLAPQRRMLAHKVLPEVHLWTPRTLREKTLSGVCDPSWDRVVVSGHTSRPAQRNQIMAHAPHIITDTRICLSAEVDKSGKLYAIELPERRLWCATPDGRVSAA